MPESSGQRSQKESWVGEVEEYVSGKGTAYAVFNSALWRDVRLRKV